MTRKLFKNPPAKFRPLQLLHGFDNLLKKADFEPSQGGLPFYEAIDAYLGWKPDKREDNSADVLPSIIKLLEKNIKYLKKMGLGGLVFNVSFADYMKNENQWRVLVEGIRQAKKVGFELWIYDEDGYPSGNAGTIVLESNPEYEAEGLLYIKDGSGNIRYEAKKVYDGTHASENVYKKRPYVNLLDGNAIKKIIEVTHKEYAKRISGFRKIIKAFFTDEPSLITPYIRRDQQFPPAVPWVKDLPDVFKKKKGYFLEPHFEKLFTDTGNDYRKVRCDYYDVVADLCAERFFGQIQDWCRRNGVKSSGHCLAEESLIWNAYFYGDLYRQERRFDLPGIDILSSKPDVILNNAGGAGFLTAKLVSSVSHVIGSEKTMSETSDYGQRSAGGASVEEMTGTANLLYVLGVNVITSYYAQAWEALRLRNFHNADPLKGKAAPDTGKKFREYKKYCDHVGRLGSMLTGGKHVCSAAVYYPIWGVLANFTPTGRSMYERQPNRTVEMINEEFIKICRNLITNQIDFDILDDKAIMDAGIHDARCTMHDERYSVIIVPPTDTIKLGTLQKLGKFVASGGKAVSVGLMPKYGAGMKEDDTEVEKIAKEIFGRSGEFLADSDGLVEYLKKIGTDDFVLDGANPNILYKHICRDKKHIYFVTNISPVPQEIEATFGVRGKPSLWYPETGKVKKVKFEIAGGRTRLELKLKDYEGVFVVF